MTGTLMRKIQRQLDSTSSPPSTGPPPAATPPTPAHIPTAVPRCCGGNTDSASPREVGISTAAPAACSARQAISAGSPGATAHPSDATPNTTSPARNNSRRPMPSAARPAGSSSVASTMAYTSRIHETSDSVAGAKSCCSAGSAMLTTHRSRTVRNWAADTTASTAHRRRPASGCPASSSSGAVTPAAVVMSSTFGCVVEICCRAEGMNRNVRAALGPPRSCCAAGRTPGAAASGVDVPLGGQGERGGRQGERWRGQGEQWRRRQGPPVAA